MEKYISEEELKTHNKREDLWISIHGKVYNVTNWVNDHPGGDLPFLYFAGQDVTEPFLAYHPISTSKYLDKFFTGYHLKNYQVSEMSKDYRELFSQFQKQGLFENKGHGTLILLVISIVMIFLSVYGIFSSDSMFVHLACGGLMGLSWIQLGWIIHDSGHYQVMVNVRWNRFIQILVTNCLTGFSIAWWKRGHNAHHIATNSLEYDPATQYLPAIVFSSKFLNSLKSYYFERVLKFDALTKLLISYQHYTFLFSLIMARTHAFAESLSLLWSKKKVLNRRTEILGMLIFWIWYPVLVSCLPNWIERIGFIVLSFGVSAIQNFQIFLNHAVCDVYLQTPCGNDWFEKQTSGSLNIECSPWMDWFHGGLQFQIEHHLFPRLPRCQLRRISPIVKELCKKHNVTYNITSFWEASLLTFKIIHDVAIAAQNFTKKIS